MHLIILNKICKFSWDHVEHRVGLNHDRVGLSLGQVGSGPCRVK